MNKTYVKFLFAFLLLGTIMTACKVTKPYETPEYSNTDRLYRDTVVTDTNTMASLPWQELFTDTVLQGLISEGIANNLDLKIAYTRVQQADAFFAQSRAAFFPTLSVTAQATESKLSAVQGFGIRTRATQLQLGGTSSWEANLWGNLSSAKRGAFASLMQSEAYSRTVQTSLVANIAASYYSLLAMDRQLAITRQTVASRITTVETVKALKEGAVVTGAAVVQSEASRYAAEVTIPDLVQSIKEMEHALSIVLGRPPSAIRRSSIEAQQMVTTLQTGLPAQLLANRPDVQQAEYNFRLLFEQTNVARTAFYPSLTITANGGISSLTAATFFDASSIFANIAGGLTQSIFNRRLNRTNLAVAKAQQQEALLGFQNTLLTAGQEVSDALSLHQTAVDKINIRANQLKSLQLSLEYSEELLKSGFANYVEVLTAQQSLLSAELSGVNDRLQQLQAIVNLYRALGGGWR